MKLVFIIFICFLLLLILLACTKLTIFIAYKHEGGDDRFDLHMKALFGIFSYRVEVPVIEMAEDSPTIVTKQHVKTEMSEEHETKDYSLEDFYNQLQHIEELTKRIVGLHTIVRLFLKKVRVRNFEWHSVVGIGDAAHTGVLIGMCWGITGNILGLIRTLMDVKETPIVQITPNFQQMTVQTHFTCMVQFRIGHAMLARIRLLKQTNSKKRQRKMRSVPKPMHHMEH